MPVWSWPRLVAGACWGACGAAGWLPSVKHAIHNRWAPSEHETLAGGLADRRFGGGGVELEAVPEACDCLPLGVFRRAQVDLSRSEVAVTCESHHRALRCSSLCEVGEECSTQGVGVGGNRFVVHAKRVDLGLDAYAAKDLAELMEVQRLAPGRGEREAERIDRRAR